MDYNKIEDALTYIDAGTIKYKIEAFYMRELDGDEKLEYLRNKISIGEHLSGKDILTLSFIPLMKGKESKGKRTLESIELAEKIPNNKEKLQCLTILYALFEKFGDDESRERFRRVVSMTEIGRMLIEEGKAKGIEEGKTKGKVEMLIKLLIKKFKIVPDEYKEKIKLLSEDTIDIIATDIFDLENIEELEKYFG